LNNGIAATLVYHKPLAAALGAGTQMYLGWRPTLTAVLMLAAGLVVLRFAPKTQGSGSERE
jgi:H+/Cl- antiporter ClcA